MNRYWLLVLVLSLLGCEVLACWLNQRGTPFADFEFPYRLFHLGQMLLLITLAAVSYRRVSADNFRQGVSILVFAGLCFSFVGDIINSFLIDLSFIIEPQTLLSTIPFAIAHFLYIGSFWVISRAAPHSVSRGFIVLTLLVWPFVAIGLWQILVDAAAGPLLKWLSLGYAHMVVLMALASFWPLKALGAAAWVATAGGLVFLLSDSIFGAWLVEGQNRPLWVSQAIWVTYFLAQLCILHVPLIRKEIPVQNAGR